MSKKFYPVRESRRLSCDKAGGGLIPLSAQTERARSSLTGFTLIELIVAVSILSVGLVVIVRSFLHISEGLKSLENRTEVIRCLESKMAEIILLLDEKGKLENVEKSGFIQINNGQIKWLIEPIVLDDNQTEEQMLDEIRVFIFWKERGRDKSSAFSRYVLIDKANK